MVIALLDPKLLSVVVYTPPPCAHTSQKSLVLIGLMDAPSTTIGSQRFNVSNFDTNGLFEYEMTFKKPADSQLWRRYSVSARIHLERCPEESQVIKRGEFITDTHFGVSLTRDKDDYEKDFKIICYGKFYYSNISIIWANSHHLKMKLS